MRNAYSKEKPSCHRLGFSFGQMRSAAYTSAWRLPLAPPQGRSQNSQVRIQVVA
ncbi:MAG: hypothetical protein ICV55_12860 [Coleofasciculus sp. C3-bin4]|nr:hypothetical protein [Coleofasciculus sp. C3-bin4]